MSTNMKTKPIRLVYSEKDAHVVIEPEDQDRFVMRVHEAINACRIYEAYKSLFEKQLGQLKDTLGTWIRERTSKIQKAFLTLQDDRMLFLLVMKDKVYDRQLEEDITDLELRIGSECTQINLDVQALPACDEDCYISFCNPGWMLEYMN